MTKFNANNERVKHKYFTFLKQAKGQNEASVDSVAKAIDRFEHYNQYKDFKAFHFEQAINFKKHLASRKHHKTGKPLSLATMNGTVRHLKAFFEWLSREIGYKSRIKYSDAEYFKLSEKDTRIATAKRIKQVPTIEQIKHTIEMMPNKTAIEKRDRALIAFTLLSGARDSAIASLKIKHINFKSNIVHQDAREVNTKFSKSFNSHFFPVGDDIRTIVYEWVNYLKGECIMGNDDPLFPRTEVGQDEDNNFKAVGISKEHWSNASAIRRIFKDAFALAGLPSYHPHSFRNTLVTLGEQICRTPEEFKAWSQNLGHEGVLTTFNSYGNVQESRQSEIFKQLNEPRVDVSAFDAELFAKAVAKEMSNHN